MLQAPGFHRFQFDPFPLFQNGLATPEVDVCGGEVVGALVVSPVIVMINERFNLCGRSYKMLTVLDEYTRQALAVTVPTRMGGRGCT